jgi:hypothetical protein
MCSYDVFYKEVIILQNNFVKAIMENMKEKNLMTPEIEEFFSEEIMHKMLHIKKTNTSNTVSSLSNEDQQKISYNLEFIKTKYNDTPPHPSCLNAAEHMIALMKHDSSLSQWNAMLQATSLVNSETNELIFPKLEEEQQPHVIVKPSKPKKVTEIEEEKPSSSNKIYLFDEPSLEEIVVSKGSKVPQKKRSRTKR